MSRVRGGELYAGSFRAWNVFSSFDYEQQFRSADAFLDFEVLELVPLVCVDRRRAVVPMPRASP